MYGLERPRTMGDMRVMFMTRSQVPQGLTVLGFRQSEQVCPTPVCNLQIPAQNSIRSAVPEECWFRRNRPTAFSNPIPMWTTQEQTHSALKLYPTTKRMQLVFIPLHLLPFHSLPQGAAGLLITIGNLPIFLLTRAADL